MTDRARHGLFDPLERTAEELEAFGQREVASAVRETLRRAADRLTAWWNEPLTIVEAAAWGGYSASQLRRLVHDRRLPVAPDGGISRRDAPIHPGHRLPLELEPAPVADRGGVADLLQRGRTRRARV